MTDVQFALAFFAVLTILVFLALPLLVIGFTVRWINRRVGATVALVLALSLLFAYGQSPLRHIAGAAAYAAVPPARLPLAQLDLALSRHSRDAAVEMVNSHQLEPGQYPGEFELPVDMKGLSVGGEIEVVEDACGSRVFFMTLTGFSPDPYAGLEYAPPPCDPEPDPLGSGSGSAQPLGDGWFWIEAR